MKERFKYLTKDRIVKTGFLLSLFLLLITFLYTVIFYNQLPPLIPLFNQLAWGVQRLGNKIMIFLPIVLCSVMLVSNMLFSQLIYEKMPLVVRMLSITTLFTSFIACIFIVRTTLLVL